jgi:hypothetical protein
VSGCWTAFGSEAVTSNDAVPPASAWDGPFIGETTGGSSAGTVVVTVAEPDAV